MPTAQRLIASSLCLLLSACVHVPSDQPPAAPIEASGPVEPPAAASEAAPASAPASSVAVAAAMGAAAAKVGAKRLSLDDSESMPWGTHLVAPYKREIDLSDIARAMMFERYAWQFIDPAKRLAPASRPRAAGEGDADVRRAFVRLDWMPMQFEAAFAQRQLKDIPVLKGRSQADRASQAKASELLAEVLRGVKEAHEFKFEILVVSASKQAIVALPGGMIIIDRDLIDRPGLQDRARFLIAHEVAHVLQRHSTRALQARVIDLAPAGATVSDLQALVQRTSKDADALAEAVAGKKVRFPRYADSQEVAADFWAVQILNRSFVNESKLTALVTQVVHSAATVRYDEGASRSVAPNSATEEPKPLVDLVGDRSAVHPQSRERAAGLMQRLQELRTRSLTKPVAEKNVDRVRQDSLVPAEIKPGGTK